MGALGSFARMVFRLKDGPVASVALSDSESCSSPQLVSQLSDGVGLAHQVLNQVLLANLSSVCVEQQIVLVPAGIREDQRNLGGDHQRLLIFLAELLAELPLGRWIFPLRAGSRNLASPKGLVWPTPSATHSDHCRRERAAVCPC